MNAERSDAIVGLLVDQLGDGRNDLAASEVLLRWDRAEEKVLAWYARRIKTVDVSKRNDKSLLDKMAYNTKFFGFDGADDAFRGRAAAAIMDIAEKLDETRTKVRCLNQLADLGPAAVAQRRRVEKLVRSGDKDVAEAAREALAAIKEGQAN
jgi:hypothetical protein